MSERFKTIYASVSLLPKPESRVPKRVHSCSKTYLGSKKTPSLLSRTYRTLHLSPKSHLFSPNGLTGSRVVVCSRPASFGTPGKTLFSLNHSSSPTSTSVAPPFLGHVMAVYGRLARHSTAGKRTRACSLPQLSRPVAKYSSKIPSTRMQIVKQKSSRHWSISLIYSTPHAPPAPRYISPSSKRIHHHRCSTRQSNCSS